MPKIYYQSDLHLEHLWHNYAADNADALFAMLPDANTSNDILVIAGDLCNDDTKALSYANQSWLKEVSSRFRAIVMVHGNHSYYGTSFGNMEAKFDKLLHEQNINNVHILRDSRWIDPVSGVLFVGGTLWTDFDKENPLAMLPTAYFMNDYRYIRTKNYRKITPNNILAAHRKSRTYIEQTINNNQDKQIVVVSHHLPSYQLPNEKYRGDPLNCFYASDLDYMLYKYNNIRAWICGHTHDSNNVMIGNCECLVNPYGYGGDNKNFDKNAHIIVDNS